MGDYGKEQTLSIEIVPKGKSSKISLSVPNTSPNSKTAAPVASVARMADSLKLGDTVKVNYSSVDGQTRITSVSRSAGSSKSKRGSSGGYQTASEAFVFVASREVQTSAGMGVAVLARKGLNMWAFSVPSEPKKPVSLADQVAAFSPGDIVAMGYKTVNYQFVLESIGPYRMSDTGLLVRVGKQSVHSIKYDAVFVKTSSNQSLTLLVSATTSTNGKTDATVLAATLKTLRTDQPVDISYHKQGGVLWLDGITAAVAAVTAKKGAR